MHTITINKIRFNVPGKWNELTREQLMKLMDMYNKQYNLAEVSVKLLLIITGIKVVYYGKFKVEVYKNPYEEYVFRYGNNIFIVDLKDIIHATSCLQFLFRIETINDQKVYILDSKLSKNLLPEIKFKWFRKWYGPADGLKNLTFSEFIHAETAFDRIANSKDDKYIDQLIAILYRQRGPVKESSKKYRGDLRESFNDFHIDRNAKIASRIPDNLKAAIMLYYQGCRYSITKLFPEVFSGSGGSKEETFKSYMNLVEVLSGYDITKKANIRNAYLYDVLLTLNESIIRDREREKGMEKIKKGIKTHV